MYRDKEMHKQDPTVVVRSKTTFNDPLKWKEKKLVFTCSWSDWFIKEADKWRKEAWDIVMSTPHTYQILTKRVENIIDRLPCKEDGVMDQPFVPDNVWLGISAENQDEFDARWPVMESLPVNHFVRFISAEPLIGPIDMRGWLGNDIHLPSWVIIGGESGNDNGKYRYRECKLEWIEDLIEQCKEAGVPVFVKQLGTHLAKQMGLKNRHGGDISEWPEHLQIRQMPTA